MTLKPILETIGVAGLIYIGLGIVGVIVLVLIYRAKTRVKAPKGCEAFKFKGSDFWMFVDVDHPQIIDVEAALQMSSSEAGHEAIERLFRHNPVAYFCSHLVDSVGKKNGQVYSVMSVEGLQALRRGEDIENPRMWMNIHSSALSDLE